MSTPEDSEISEDTLQTIEAIRNHFDPAFYLRTYDDVATAGIDPILHYVASGADERRDPSAEFSTQFYLDSNPDVAAAGVNPLFHYIRWGRDEGRQPRPVTEKTGDPVNMGEAPTVSEQPPKQTEPAEAFDFEWYRLVYLSDSASELDCVEHFRTHNTWGFLRKSGPAYMISERDHFDPRFYVERYPDIKSLDPWQHYVAHGYYENRRPSRYYHSSSGDLEQTLRYAEQALVIASGQEYLLSRVAPSTLSDLEVSAAERLDEKESALQKLISEVCDQCEIMIVTGSLNVGGAERYATNLYRGFMELCSARKVMFVVTDTATGDGIEWLPAGANILSFSETLGDISQDERRWLIQRLISIIQPRKTICVNSLALWQGIVYSGKGLTNFTDLYASLFCYDYLPDGSRGGYAAVQLRETIQNIACIIVDNSTFREQLITDYSLPDTTSRKIRVLRSPATYPDGASIPSSSREATGKILWAGRLVRQKQPLLVLEIARLCPHLTFDMFGGPGDLSSHLHENLPPNVHLRDGYNPLQGLPTKGYEAFLYTSLWDGIPTILLDAAAGDLPIVASHSGGIAEVVDNNTGWLIGEVNDAAAYAAALTFIHDHPGETEKRTVAMRELLKKQHSWNSYLSALMPIHDQRGVAPHE